MSAAGAPGAFLSSAAAEVEAYVGRSGWDQRPCLFALVRAARFAADEPETARRLGLAEAAGDTLTPIEQDALPEGALDEALGSIAWPQTVAGCALSQEILILPPGADAEVSDQAGVDEAARHPERREARLVVAALRDGTTAAVLRLRGTGGTDEQLLTGPDLAPNLAAALLATFAD